MTEPRGDGPVIAAATGRAVMPDHYARIFLLSHMRAFTSLAGHILGSHPAINGYFEMHISYTNAAALDRQLEIYRQYETLKARSRYVFDKLLHNDYHLDSGQLAAVDMKILVSLLEPDRSIRSIVDLFVRRDPAGPYASPAGACAYYNGRLEALAAFCRTESHPYCYYDAELLQAAPPTLLARLADWLALETPLSDHYRLFSQTGRPRRGDSSALIRSGRIERTPRDYSHIHIPDDLLTQARAVYRDCRAVIIGRAADAVLM